jgi:transposase
LSCEQEQRLKERINLGPTVKDEVSNFDALSIKDIIRNECSVEFSTSGVYSFLHRVGLSWTSTRPQHEKNDPSAMSFWKRTTLPETIQKTQASRPNTKIEIWFQDEMRFGEKTTLSRRWCLKASAPRNICQLGFRNTYIYGAINPATGERVGLVNHGCNSEAMNIHLDLVSQHLGPDRHAILILDQAGWHEKSNKIIVPKNITLLSLPPYSPELNPVERLWRWIKGKYLANRVINKSEDLELLGCELWNKITDEVVKSVCRVRYLPL